MNHLDVASALWLALEPAITFLPLVPLTTLHKDRDFGLLCSLLSSAPRVLSAILRVPGLTEATKDLSQQQVILLVSGQTQVM